MSKVTIPSIVVVLGLKPTAGIPALIGRSKAIVSGIQENPKLFPSPVPSIAQALTHIADLSDAETAFKSHLGPVAVRDDKKHLVVGDMHQYHGYVLQLAHASPEQAQVIVEAATMTLRKPNTAHKSDLAVKPVVSGSVKVVAKAAKGARAHLWQYSVDGGKTWIDVPASAQASTTIHNLTPGVMVTYRQRAVTKEGPGDWCPPISALVT